MKWNEVRISKATQRDLEAGLDHSRTRTRYPKWLLRLLPQQDTDVDVESSSQA